MDRDDVLWLAGLLEGEGCFDMKPQPPHRPVSRIRLQMTDEDVVQRVADLFQRTMTRSEPRGSQKKPVFYTQIQGLPAREVMVQVRPFMGARRGAKIDEILGAPRA